MGTRRPWARVAVGATAAALVACGGAAAVTTSTPTSTPVPTATVADPADPRGPTSRELADVVDCPSLHARVLDWLDDAAERADRLQPDGDALTLIVGEAVLMGEVPEGLEPVEGLLPGAAYGGIAGAAARDRYDALGCTADDEADMILAWFDLPPDTALRVDAGPLHDEVRRRMEAGAGGFVALGLGRRLAEGLVTSDSALMAALADVAAAQEAFRAETGTYAPELEDLRSHLDDPGLVDWDADGPLVIVTKATADAYCIHGADGGSAQVESHDGVPRARTPGSPSCPNTFPDIDD